MAVVPKSYIDALLKNYVVDLSNAKPSATGAVPGAGAPGSKSNAQVATEQILAYARARFVNLVSKTIPSFATDDAQVTYTYQFASVSGDKNNRVLANINIDDSALHRDSIRSVDKHGAVHQGEGIRDVLALFTHGYRLAPYKHIPYGEWTHHNASDVIVSGARCERKANHFMTNIASILQSEITTKFNVTCVVTLNTIYQ